MWSPRVGCDGAEDVDRVVGELAAQGLMASTRRGYLQAFKGFHAFLLSRKRIEIETAFVWCG